MVHYLNCILSIAVTLGYPTLGAEILFLLPISTISHHMFLTPFVSALSERGNNITLFTKYPNVIENKNVTTIFYKDPIDLGVAINEMAYSTHKEKPFEQTAFFEKKFAFRYCESFAKNEFFRESITNGRRFNLVFTTAFFEECSFILANLLSDNIVYISFMRHVIPSFAYRFGVPSMYSFFPNVISHQTSSMNLPARFWNFMTSAYAILRRDYDYKGIESIVREHLPHISVYEDVKCSVIFTNSDPVLSEPVPSFSWIIPIGGLQCRPAKSLPKEIDEIVSSGPFILFSLGTLAEITTIGNDATKPFIEAFARLKEIVVWKTKEKFADLPKNVKTLKWIPQQDVLGHKNIKLFISQGGIFGLQEAIYHAVPLLVMPQMIDQFSNAARIEELGIGKKLNSFQNLTANGILSSMQMILNNQDYKNRVNKYSRVFKDQSDTALERALFCAEHLMRNGGETNSYLTSLSLFQYFLLDIIGFMLLLVVGSGFSIWYLFRRTVP